MEGPLEGVDSVGNAVEGSLRLLAEYPIQSQPFISQCCASNKPTVVVHLIHSVFLTSLGYYSSSRPMRILVRIKVVPQ